MLKYVYPLFLVYALWSFGYVVRGNAQTVTVLFQNFDSVAAHGIPSGWTTTSNRLPSGDWWDSTLTGQSSPQVCYNVNATIEQILTTPSVNFSGKEADSVFFYARRSSSYNAINSIEVSTDGGTSWTVIDTLSASISTSSMKRFGFPIPSFVSGQPEVKFRYRNQGNGTGTSGANRLDDFIVIATDTTLNDGDGTASLVNSTAGTLNGSTMFNRSTTGQSVTVAVAGLSTGSLDKVRITVPSSFTGFSNGNVSLGGSLSGKSTSILSNQITVLSADLGTAPGTVTISNLTSPNPSGGGLDGNDTWLVETATPGGTLTPIAASPKSITIIPIQNLRVGGVDGFGNSDTAGTLPVLDNRIVAVQGVITLPNNVLADSSSTSLVIQDGAYGMQIMRNFSNTFGSLVKGNTIIVKGNVSSFHGNTAITPSSVAAPDLYNLGGSTVISPSIVASAASINESNEGKLVKLNTVSWDSAGQSFLASVSNRGIDNFVAGGDSGTIYLNSVNDAVGNTIPSASSLTGIVYHRNDLLNAHQRVWKIAPRNKIDLGFSVADGSGTAAIAPAVRVANAVAVAETLVITGDGFNTLAGVSISVPSTWAWTDTSSRSLSGTGFGSATSSVSGNGSAGTPYIITITGAAVTNASTGKVIVSHLNAPASGGATIFIVKTRGTSGFLSAIASSPSVSIAAGGFEAIVSGNWSSGSTWSGGIAPTAADDVTMTTLGVIVTIDGTNAQCRNLTMTGSGSVSSSGPMLEFSVSGSPQLTINGDLSIGGGSGGGGGNRGGRPQLTSNGNAGAVLILKHNISTTSSNSASNGNAGLNMNEGVVKILGSSTDSIRNSSGFRLADLVIGDGVSGKTLVWAPTKRATMVVSSLTVKTGSTFLIGSASDSIANDIGNASSSGVPTLMGGIKVESGAGLIVQNFSGGDDGANINLDGGGIVNNGTVTLESGSGYSFFHETFRFPAAAQGSHYTLNIGGFSAGASSSKQTIGGSASGQFADIIVGTKDTLVLQQEMNVASNYRLTLTGTLNETPGNTVIGTVEASRVLTDSSSNNFGGIGCTIDALGFAPGPALVRRVTGTPQVFNGHHSILRSFEIVPASNSGLNASFDFSYDASELGGEDPSTLQIWESTNSGSTWFSVASSNNVAGRTVSAIGINTFGKLTLCDASNSFGSGIYRYAITEGWNLISVPVIVGDFRKSILYPNAVSSAFAYTGGYLRKDTLSNGIGYWLKSAIHDTAMMAGVSLATDTIAVVDGWNMIGSITDTVAVNGIFQIPAGIVASSYFGYNGSYQVANAIVPGKGYWLKTTGGGKLVLSATGQAGSVRDYLPLLEKLNKLTVTDRNGIRQALYFGVYSGGEQSYELPPPPPAGLDVRFASQRFVETYPADCLEKEFPISLQGSSSVQLQWHIVSSDRRYELIVIDHGKVMDENLMQGDGSVELHNIADRSLLLKLRGKNAQPVEFSLGSNYPNPFNPSTEFSISLPRDARVTLEVYDILGKKVRTLLDEMETAGTHRMTWNGVSDANIQLSSGMYFLKMRSENFNAVRKMVMLK